MKSIFDKASIHGMELRNRVVRSATWEGMCDSEGRPSEKLASLYGDLARGRTALIISGYTFVSPEGKQMPGKMGIHRNDFAGEMKALAHAVHDEGGKICMQLVHAGGQTTSKMAGRQPLAPSAVDSPQFPEIPAEMTERDIESVLSSFSEGASRAREYGFDAIQLHAAHGYLINQFLSPLTNRREDKWGGNVEKRARFLLEAYKGVRSSVGKEFPVIMKFNSSDFLEGGLEYNDALFAAELLSSEGMDAIEVSGGTGASGKNTPVRTKIREIDQEAYNLPHARGIGSAVSCPIIVVGGLRSFDVAEGIVQRGEGDFVSLSRPLIREPDLVKRWEEGNREKAECISCNGCFKPGIKEGGIYCVKKKKDDEKKERNKHGS